MAVPNINGFRVKKGNETGIAKIATDAILDKAVTKAKLSQPVQTEINKIANKADQDGDYDTLTAGGAKQLLSTVYVDDNEPYNFRTAGGSADIGDRMYEEVVGGTVAWNQLIYDGDFALPTGQGVTPANGTITTSNGELSFAVTDVSGAGWRTNVSFNASAHNPNYLKAGHKVLLHYETMPAHSKRTGPYIIKVTGTGSNAGWDFALTENVWNTCETIKPVPSDILTGYWQIGIAATSANGYAVGDVDKFRNVFSVDLTQMFGSTIADYIYSLEQGTSGAGVAWFRKLFPKPYYAYNVGELMSVKAGSHDTVGFNQINNLVTGQLVKKVDGTFQNNAGYARTDYIRVLPNTTYYFKEDNVTNGEWAAYYDANKVFVSGTDLYPNNTFTTPSNAYYLITSLRVENVDNVCINLSWDGERNGEYEPYEKHTYPLDELELRGIPKLDANNQLYYDGDTYASDGTVTRRFNVVNLGQLTPSRINSGNVYIFDFALGGYMKDSDADADNFVCSKYTPMKKAGFGLADKECSRAQGSAHVYVRDDSYTDVASFKAAMNGVYIVIEAKEPTTETADTFVNPQVVDDFGTEEYVDYAEQAGDRDVAIPVGHNSQYMNNLRAKLEMAPESPSGDGKYIVQQNNGENAYIPYTADGRLDAIEAKLPASPSANGTYKLTATVTDGGVTYTWVAG